jgi:hypothetical protein
MTTCSVHFYRNVLGVPFAVPKGSVQIRLAHSESRALEAAKRKFARRFGVKDWRLRADQFDIVSADPRIPS